MNKPELPIVWHQVKKIKDFWVNSKSPSRDWMIDLFNETLKDIENTYLLELELWEEKQEELSA